jgi:pimeloyl-ACP methyl ester carboxylesterase
LAPLCIKYANNTETHISASQDNIEVNDFPTFAHQTWGQRLLLLNATILLAACAQLPTPQERTAHADKLAAQAGWKQQIIATDDFKLAAYLPARPSTTQTLTVYLEGDGLAWLNSSTPSLDPTPNNPLALKLALRDRTPSVYLARPCQYVDAEQQRNCPDMYWTSHRFAPEVIRATGQAVDQLKRQFAAQNLILVGYSGGGAVAALLAAQRRDVVRLITIAGNLDHRNWTTERHLSPLTGSLNPPDVGEQLKMIPQQHYVGGKDRVVGESVARSYAARFTSGLAPTIVVIPDFDHHCCWEDRWPALKDEAK